MDAQAFGRTEAAAAPPAPYVMLVAGLTFLLTMIAMVDRAIIGVLMPAIKADLHLSDSALGLMSGIPFAICVGVTAIPVGWLVDTRWQRTATVSIALGFWSAMTMLCGAATGIISLFLARMGVGAGEGAGAATSISVVIESTPPAWKRRAIMVCNWGSIGGQALALAAGGWLVTLYGWRWTFVLVGAPGLLLALVYYLSIKEPPRQQNATKSLSFLADLRVLLKSKPYVHFLLATGFGASIILTLVIWMPTYLQRSYGMEMTDAGKILGAIMLVSGLAGPFSYAWLGDILAKRDKRWPLWLCCGSKALTAPLLIGLFLLADQQPGYVLLAIAIFLSAGLAPLLPVAAQDLAPEFRTTAIAGMTVIASLIGAILPWIVGIVSDLAGPASSPDGLRAGMLTIIPAALLSAAFYWLAARAIVTRDSGENICR